MKDDGQVLVMVFAVENDLQEVRGYGRRRVDAKRYCLLCVRLW